ncbi:pyridine nucleotide-disulfide oxidoreductase [Streptomyces sulfonofaciens]|uniref:Pyridine nucleotide-disulfide oxidoreductase n=1 Tax=Streptomyces sulfonofaciens TaxID=68272 RepID=A0A919GFW4_9ACTN|nr:FAD-dependent oxidoreductase [Streptomyces sulfonofaciens]GHH84232.1 pyridine nucleotide-disulfide oxidoreductase [Streptomyces sulfonofaciens]
MSTTVVVGSSVAGVRTAQALRTEGYDGRVVLVGAEPGPPYDKPPLSKQFLSGARQAHEVTLLTAQEAHLARIELRLGSAARCLDVAARRLRLADGAELAYDTCVIATGAAARPSPWPVRSGLHVVRTLADSAALRADLLRGGPVVVVGGGFVGAEVAATARGLGCAVTVVDPLPVPMGRLLGPEVGAHFTALHERHGVATRFGTGVEAVTGESGRLRVALTDKTVLPAATVVVGIGAVPNDRWLAGSGLLLDDGVVCDEFCRAVGTGDVYAAGDVARWYHPGHGTRVRVEHWTNAVDQAALVARNITRPEHPQPYAPVPYVWSDQYDWKIQIAGTPADATRHTVVGRLSGGTARGGALYGDDSGRLCAAVTVNWPRALVECRRLLAGQAPFDTALDRVDRLAARAAGRPGATR